MIFDSPNIQSGIVHLSGIATKSPNFQNLLSKSQIYLGFNATQNQNYVVFKKTDLTGLTPTSNNTAESLLVAITNRLIDTVGTNKRIEAEAAYWGAFTESGAVEKTIELKFYNLLSVVDYEIQYSDIVSPMDY
ncbi:hypothetical protein [[Scytonema hofmanni] UTEX B 1581]|uniref:hypothetical protein n=1 Tax=[Scytonema hofmanni] UTEX B 1581 TaxID=379535 RepID=UPI000495D8E4|nr:hypothetical protein [[Scytonema hofmanni] UTEX B 1581]